MYLIKEILARLGGMFVITVAGVLVLGVFVLLTLLVIGLLALVAGLVILLGPVAIVAVWLVMMFLILFGVKTGDILE